MLTGKSTSSAFRGHLLVDRCLISQVFSQVFSTESYPQKANILSEASTMYDSVLSHNATADEVTSSVIFLQLKNLIVAKKHDLCTESKTAMLWLAYQHMVGICRKLVAADQSCCWTDNLQTIQEALPLFAAAGHFNYLKSASLYLQKHGCFA